MYIFKKYERNPLLYMCVHVYKLTFFLKIVVYYCTKQKSVHIFKSDVIPGREKIVITYKGKRIYPFK